MSFKNITENQDRSGEIPEIVRYLGGVFAWKIVEIWGLGGVGEYLLASSTQRHIWHAALSVDPARLPPPASLKEWLTGSRRRDILTTAFGSVPPGIVKLLSKLNVRAEATEFYMAAYTALSRRDALCSFLQHQQEIDPNMVLCIARLPCDPVTSKIAAYALKQGVSPFEIGELSWLGKRMMTARHLNGVRDTAIIKRNPHSALRNEIARLPFPPPPWEVAGIAPVRSSKALFDIARDMKNCLLDRDHFYSSTLDVQAGIAYYFRTMSDDCLLLKFSKFGQLGWYLDECRGANNRRPTLDEIQDIELSLNGLEDVWGSHLSYKVM